VFPDGNALGKRIRLVSRTPETYEVVGVVGDAAFKTLGDPHQAAVFRAVQQDTTTTVPQPIMLVRVHGDVAAVANAFQLHLPAQTPHFVRSVHRFDEYIDQVLLRDRLVTWLSSFFAVLAVLLSCIGLYGLLAYSVARRTREIGIRMALGATPHAIMQIVGRESIVLGAVGVAVGLPCALIAGRFLRTMLYGLEPSDPATITVAAFALAALSAIAGLIPAYRASAIDPNVALRHD
jgi:predicted lysophospholipase L1 biosynthesis ABC-type transport system permease subunit